MNKYEITCNCGHKISGDDKREVEARMWEHAIKDHNDMLKSMTAEQFLQIMTGWDEKFAKQARTA